MRGLINILVLLVCTTQLAQSQSPHGENFVMDCAKCHSPESWSFNSDKTTFSHDSTSFKLNGQHADVDCKTCHNDLAFSNIKDNCASCHNDMHLQTVGTDCARCHTANNWLVADVLQLHEKASFPLIGVHKSVSCESCHLSENSLRFDPIGTNCESCHLKDYQNTINPDHNKAGFSTNCAECHNVFDQNWGNTNFDHSFFPLEQGHDIADCAKCHTSTNYSEISSDCISCHTKDFDNTNDPNHNQANFSTNCAECHTTIQGWNPAKFSDHDESFFPIYSGKHAGVWENCTTCHSNTNDYTQFNCITCHLNPETNDLHASVNGYNYNDNACLACHPTGDKENAFDHNSTNFPLTGAHANTDCINCHATGYQGTSSQCVDCHLLDFQSTTNPEHIALNLSQDCAACHTTELGWKPATFDIHDDYYVIEGAHIAIKNDCAACHTSNFNATPNTCYGCHKSDYDDTNNPNHLTAQFSQDCATCHSQNQWSPSEFDHDNKYFPIYSGKHSGVWSQCSECHTNSNDFTQFTCVTCHLNPETDDAHAGIGGYSYNSNACLACHPTGDTDNVFDHNNTNFPLTGAHRTTDCINCHAAGYQGTSSECFSCHSLDYNTSSNPNHVALSFPTDCASCHTTEPGWSPAKFEIHYLYYDLIGAHADIVENCASCHNGNYNTTPNTCYGCHKSNYESSVDPNHIAAHFETDCIQCHGQNNWLPATFDHDGLHFPIYSGQHVGAWTQCVDCHSNQNDFSQFNCTNCHINPETDQSHLSVGGYSYNDNACFACHPTGSADLIFDHNSTSFPLTGAHISVECISCHITGFNATSTECFSCHQTDFNTSINPPHQALGFPTDCASCHTTQMGWAPAQFPIHDNFYPLTGAHAAIANECATCHNGDYINTPNTCVGCHQTDFNGTTDPNHTTANFPTDCASCHSENSWVPSTFEHDAMYYPIYSGAHNGVWNQCAECHQNPSDFTQFTCTTCHQNPETNDQHATVNGYSYNSNACLACHPTGEADGAFDHNTTNFPLTGAHTAVDCIQCHANGYSGTPTNCDACHTLDYNSSINPPHQALGFPTDCATCHTTQVGWAPAQFPIHDNFYPLTGAHAAIANECAVCHNGDYINTPNECVGCHQTDFNTSINPPHQALGFPTDCASCHTTQVGWAPAQFPIHDNFYPLTGAHAAIANDCAACHNGDYINTPNECVGCHQTDFNTSINPPHQALGFPTDCASCHTTQVGWAPAQFPIHDNFYPLTGAHAAIANECATCHNGDYINTPNTCVGCHQTDFNGTTDPNHTTANFPTDCASCHSENSWVPSTFDHDGLYFPIYSGAHNGVWNQCAECHQNPSDFTQFTCTTCHQNPETNNQHQTVSGYSYNSSACLACHPTGEADGAFDHNTTNFPLTGAHTTVDCIQCHANGYSGTPTNCDACHTLDYNGSINPPHQALGFPTDCASCHTTQVGWAPAQFPIHDNFYPLTGAHAAIANECAVCHNGDYINTPNECVGCHQTDFNTSINPPHQALGFPTDCASCHTTQVGWAPAQFPIHDNFYPLTGAHAAIANDCAACHNGDYINTPNECVGCHQTDFSTSINPPHQALGFPTDCASCHTTQMGWAPAQFPIHDNFYPLNGAHAAIANECATCHNGDYINTPNTCVGCHQTDFNGTTDPNHTTANFPTDCASCHSESSWVPSTFEHDAMYFPIYSGAHNGVWNQCAECHQNPSDFTQFTCTTCHQNPETNDQHATVNGYSYNSSACLACHPTGEADGAFDHNTTNFPLTGAHTSVDCIQCHANGYSGTPTNCDACHTLDYNGSINPPHQALGFPTDCATCHTTQAGWAPAQFPIHDNFYPLTGAHAAIANDCAACHNGDYINTPNECVGCHQSDFNTSINPPHQALGFPTDCATCHTTQVGWAPAQFPIHDNFYQLNGAHAAIANECATCHNGDYINTPNTCVGCHQSDFNGTTDPNHTTANFPTDCASCHSESSWVPSTFEHDAMYFPIYSGAHNGVWNQCAECHQNPSDFTQFTCTTCHQNPETNDQHATVNGYSYNSSACLACHPTGEADGAFDHNSTNFPLTGAHTSVDCIQCHANGYSGTPTNCDACHTLDYNGSINPPHQALGFPTDCATCHTTQAGWAPAQFPIHDNFYPLTGAHAAIANDCAACHNGDYINTPNECVGCHQTDFNTSINPPHQALGFPTDCATCHTTQAGWAPAQFPIHDNFYPLTGAHAAIANDCAACHNGDYINTPNECVGCHQTDFNTSINPPHQALGFPTDCATCHTTQAGWAPAQFPIHDNFYQLNGAHAAIANECATCHNGDYINTPNTCVGCHQSDFNGTTDPNHTTANFPTDCASCHSESSWVPSTFEHDALYFPIYSGAHNGVWNQCAECHQNPSDFTQFTCTTCHQNPETNNQHTTVSGYSYNSSACLACHPTGEADGAFDHNTTNFPLTGAHTTVDCIQCHANGYSGTPTNCDACHTLDYNGSINPPHQALGFPTDCASCHTTQVGWAPAQFPIHDNFYPLTGAHAAIANDCAVCHNGDYINTPNECVGCHQTDFSTSINPPHQALGFPTDCASCHTTQVGWAPAQFPIHDNFYPLTGAHAAIANDCAACHNGDYINTPNECVGCHQTDFSTSINPPHQALGFPTDCASCHTTQMGWAPAQFPIHDNFYPLNGAHAAIANECATCHNGDYINTPNTCVGCHQTDFNGTTDPDHTSANFPTDCASCHSENSWVPSTFEHDAMYFPIYSGTHNGVWNQCAECHQNPSDFTQFTCTTCHQNPETNNQHQTVSGYSYNSSACLACHPTGEADGAFDHNSTNFPLTGAHTAVDCIQCHANGYSGTPTNCDACHTLDYNGSINPPHQALGFPTDCASCHTTQVGWAPAQFPIHDNFYPLTGAHAAIANDCAACHNGDYINTPNECVGCHQTDFSTSINPPHQALGFPTDCASCHTTQMGWAPAQFPIHDNFYPLTGAHAAIANECAVCHNGDYINTPNECVGCHQTDFSTSINPPHQALGFPTDCASCHTTQVGWAPAQFPIHDNFYPLNGAHAAIANECATCHNGDYINTPNTCVGCHQSDFNGTTDPNHTSANFPTDCASCHSENSWTPSTFEHDAMYFPIYSGTHNGVWNQCAECHQNPSDFTQFTCTTCHQNPETNNQHQTVSGYSYNSSACLACHPTGEADGAFDHNSTNFPLTGAHTTVDCIQCHANGYSGTPTNCDACHTLDYNGSINPPHQALGFPTDCASCHTTQMGWAPAQFPIHDNFYPLTGAHAAIANDCAACHNGDYINTPNECVGCHQTDFSTSINPPHQALGFPTDCASCHTTQMGWAPAQFPIHDNFYPLTGAHAAIANDCAACHNGDYINIPNECVGCHQTDFSTSINPPHQALGFPTDCASCHTTQVGWAPAQFPIHDNFYPLNGAHAAIANECATCHNGDYINTPNTCVGCHQSDFNGTTDPNHTSANFPTDCASCHSENSWTPSTFEHDAMYFPIYNGTHNGVWNQCAECHQTPSDFTQFTCTTCHQNPETNNQHQTVSGYSYNSSACLACHPTGEADGAFDHNSTNFPLTGAHTVVDCIQCHANGYSGTPTNCDACHTLDYNSSINPPHQALGFPTDCASCHTTQVGWAPAQFPIHDNFYPLTGAHAAIANDCAACHNGDYINTPNECVGCHQTDYNATMNPDHEVVMFPNDCTLCHNNSSWIPSTFNHNDYFVIDGAHLAVDCNSCHNGDYTNTPNTCAGCHLTDYDGTANPSHSALSIPTDCAMCHTTVLDWNPASFPIHNDYYVIEGAHTALSCAECHNGNYNNTPNTCFGCHQSDYNGVTSPNHVNQGYPLDCTLCHNQMDWGNSSFNHDQMYFPIYSGKHKNKWDQCIECHNNPNDYSVFTCLTCHLQGETNNDHDEVNGYQYNSDACLSCHPDGND